MSLQNSAVAPQTNETAQQGSAESKNNDEISESEVDVPDECTAAAKELLAQIATKVPAILCSLFEADEGAEVDHQLEKMVDFAVAGEPAELDILTVSDPSETVPGTPMAGPNGAGPLPVDDDKVC